MFDKSHRFSFKKGAPKRVFQSSLFSFRFQENAEGLRSSVVVSKKIDKRAVVRNRIKRQLNEMLKKNIDATVPFDLVIYVRKEIATADSSRIQEELLQSLKKTNLLS